jgi:hypothetical protein
VDVVTMESSILAAQVEARTVHLDDIVVEDFNFEGTARVTVAIENLSGQTIRDTALWVQRGGWKVEPERDYVEVPPGETGTLTAYASNRGLLFPVPVLRLKMPVGNGDTLSIAEPLRIKRLTALGLLAEPPGIDGILDDSAWNGVHWVTDFYGGSGGEAATGPTKLKLGLSSGRVFIGVECLREDMDELRAGVADRDGFLAYDDYISVLFEPVRGSQVFYQIGVNPRGVLFDRKIEICPFGTYVAHPEWDPDIEVAALVRDDRWIVEMAIPLDSLGEGAAPAGRWGFNFRRRDKYPGAVADFQPPMWYDTHRLGLLGFE